eukprot:3422277-Pyramimonas_sp.AAC.1
MIPGRRGCSTHVAQLEEGPWRCAGAPRSNRAGSIDAELAQTFKNRFCWSDCLLCATGAALRLGVGVHCALGMALQGGGAQ